MPKQLNAGQITQALQRAFGFKGRYVPMLDEVIVPVYVIQDPAPSNPTRLCAGVGDLVVVATINEYVQLFNPVGSGNIVNVTNVVTSSDVKLELLIAFFDSTVGLSVVGNHFRDRRLGGSPSSVIRTNSTQVGGAGDRVAIVAVDGALSQTAAWEASTGDPRQPLAVLGEGRGLIVQKRDQSVTGTIRVNFRYLEIPQTQENPAGGIPG